MLIEMIVAVVSGVIGSMTMGVLLSCRLHAAKEVQEELQRELQRERARCAAALAERDTIKALLVAVEEGSPSLADLESLVVVGSGSLAGQFAKIKWIRDNWVGEHHRDWMREGHHLMPLEAALQANLRESDAVVPIPKEWVRIDPTIKYL